MKFPPGRKSSSGGGDSRRSSNADVVDDVTEHKGNVGKASSSTAAAASPVKRSSLVSVDISMADPLKRRYRDEKVVGLGDGARRALHPADMEGSKKVRYEKYHGNIPLQEDERYARSKVETRPVVLVMIGYYTALKIFVYYLISLSSVITVGLSVGLTIYWYDRFQNDPSNNLTGTGMDWVLLGFAVITPLSLSVGIAFRRRERALVEIAKFRSFSFQLFLSHCIWDWGLPPDGGKAAANIDWVEHADDVLRELVAVGDELCRFLTLPTASRSRHRMTRSGRREAARTAEVAYRLYDSLYTSRFIRLSQLSERIKLAGLGASEVSRMRQYERFMGEAIENLRMIKTYRTPQTLRSFARLFTTLLPPFFAPTYAQLAVNVGNLGIGIAFAVITSLCLNALLEGVEILEDPFVAFVTLDGVDTREEFQVRINHFPGMTNICRKARLAQSLELMRKKFPKEFSFYPATYILPQGLAAFRALFPNGQSKGTFIVKPDGSAQGKGIFLTRRIEDIENLSSVCVAQQYIRNPLLIEKKKFDLRIYVLVTSCSPLRLYLFRDGLVRICTEEYKRPTTSNMGDRCMHLTNYSVNKRSDKYERDERGTAPSNLGSKRSIRWLLEWLAEEKSEAAASKMWSRIGDICVMTIISILPILRREYAAIFEKKTTPQDGAESSSDGHATINRNEDANSRCFELLGFDVMVDSDLKPSLIEVNHLPSWGTDSPIDEDIKSRVITQALSAINVNAQDRRCYESSRRKQSRMRLRNNKSTSPSDAVDDDGNIESNVQPRNRRKRVDLYDSNSAERRIRAVYEKHAPEKLGKVKDLLSRYRGYEEWLAKKVEEKYSQDDDDDSSTSSEEDDSSSEDEPEQFRSERERKRFEQEERLLRDYDRIYPPSKNGHISASRYREMERYVTEMDEQQQRRLTCPLQQMRTNGNAENEFNTHGQYHRGDGWIGGNVHMRPTKGEEVKLSGPPTKKQVELADRLSRGYSVEDTDVSEKLIKKKSRILHHDFIYEEENPFYHLIDRVRQSRELSKEARRRAERRLHERSSKSGAPLKQQVLQLGLGPFTLEDKSKFYTKRGDG